MKTDPKFLNLLVDFSVATGFIPLVSGIIRLKHIKQPVVFLFILSVVAISVEIIDTIYYRLGSSNAHIFHAFTIIEFTLISMFYGSFFKKYFNPLAFYIVIPIFFSIAFVDYRTFGLENLDSISMTVECVIVICYSLFLFYYALKHLLFDSIMDSSIFWLNAALLIYFSGNLLLFVSSAGLIDNNPDKHFTLWSFLHSFFNIMFNIILTVGFWKTKTK